MSLRLAILECLAQHNPTERTGHALADAVPVFTGRAVPGSHSLADEEWVGLRPLPVDCQLPRTGQEPQVRVWGYASCSAGLTPRPVLVSCVEALVDEPSSTNRPPLEDAVARAGTLFASRSLPDLATTTAILLRAVRPGLAQALDTSLIVDTQSRRVRQHLARLDIPAYAQGAETARPIGGRLVAVNDPDVPLPIALMEAPSQLDLPDAGRIEVDVGVDALPLGGDDAGFMTIAIRPRVALGDSGLTKLAEAGRAVLVAAVAHLWLLRRAQLINGELRDRVEELLRGECSRARLHQIQLDMSSLRVRFLEGIELHWGLDDAKDPEDEPRAVVDRLAKLSADWRHERHRFDGLWTAAGVAAIPRPPVTERPAGVSERIKGFTDESNPFVQVGMYLRWIWPTIEEELSERRSRARFVGTRISYRATTRGGARLHSAVGNRLAKRLDRGHDPGLDREPPKPDPNVKEIEVHPFRNRWALFEELNSSIALTTFMTTTSVVFLGLVLAPSSGGARLGGLNLDVLFLFIASFGFFFSTLLYSNASGQLARHGTTRFEGLIENANRVSEYLGVYPLLLALPLTVSRYLGHGFVPITVSILAWVSMLAYHYARNSSLLERDISDTTMGSNRWRRRVFIPLLLVTMGLTFVGTLTDVDVLAKAGGLLYGALMLLYLAFSALVPERGDPSVYEVHSWDVLGEETPTHFAEATAKGRSGTS